MIKKGNRLFFQYSQLGNGNMAAFHYPLAYKTQVTGFHGRLQINPLRNGILENSPSAAGAPQSFPSALR